MEENKLKNDSVILQQDGILNDVKRIIKQAAEASQKAIDIVLLRRNRLIGKRIYEEELKECRSENYGLEIIKQLSVDLTKSYGKGYSKSNLYTFYKFYKLYSEIFNENKDLPRLLSRSHYQLLIGVDDLAARAWYEEETSNNYWSVRVLERNINTKYYYRLMSSKTRELSEVETSRTNKKNVHDHIRSPYILEFLGFDLDKGFFENELEEAIISNLQAMLIELGKGFAFVKRQYHLRTKSRDYFVDLVFYNYILKCFVIIDLKTEKITHNDVSQMDMYVRMFDELVKSKDDNPTVGIVLCADTDEDVARYSILNDSDNIFASKYKLYLPTDEELKEEINKQKELFYLCHQDKITKK